SKSLALISKSTRLIVSLQNRYCDFSISDDHTTLLFQSKRGPPISSIHLQLSAAEHGVIQSLDVPCHKGRSGSVRIDAFCLTVFGASDPIENVIYGELAFLSSRLTGEASTFNLLVKLTFGGKISVPNMAKITSAVLRVDYIPVPVSKEVLGLTSDFFYNLFYCDFMEKITGTFNIGQVNPVAFISFIDSLTQRRKKVDSVEDALSMLNLADRFCFQIPIVLKGILPYLKEFKLNTMSKRIRRITLAKFMDLSTRCGGNEEFVLWIFESCQSAMELSSVAQSSATTLARHQKEFFQALSNKQMEDKQKTKEKILSVKLADQKRMEREVVNQVQKALSAHRQTHTCQPTPESLEWIIDHSNSWFVEREGEEGAGRGG
ncbi:hypothetical protein PMAYCL1PPCAC_20852, partial [Pristionchus mayeri]